MAAHPSSEAARPRSEAAFAGARAVLAGGVDSPVRAFGAVGGTPLFADQGRGAVVRDIDGKAYLDFCQSWGAIILGHGDRGVARRVARRARRGSSFGMPVPGETVLASLIRDAMPSLERLRFVSSGTEAVMSALRLARAFTGRDLVLKFDGAYHGHADYLLVAAGSGLATGALSSSAGVPESLAALTLSVPYNDSEAVREAFALNQGRIAAIIVEPVAANMGLVSPDAGFLKSLRDIADRNGALLVFDEVITGFRVDSGGAQALYDVRPDLTTLGKVIGGGFPVGAYGGRKDIMDLLAPGGPVYQAGTLSGNPVAMDAGIEVLTRIRKDGLIGRIRDNGIRFAETLRPRLDPERYCLNQVAGLFTVFCRPAPVRNFAEAQGSDRAAYARLFHGLIARGVYSVPSQFEANFIGAAHRDKDLSYAVESFATAASDVAHGVLP